MTHYANSESIFSVIGDYPVTDQFDVSYSNLQEGSIYDNYVTGSFFKKNSKLKTIIIGNRGKVFSRLKVESNVLPSGILANDARFSAGYHLQPWRERAGLIRNVRIFSENERFYDSLTPDLIGSFKALDGKIIKIDLTAVNSGIHNAVIFDNDIFNPTEEVTGLSPVGFESSFPFEPIFSRVVRKRKISESFLSETAWDVTTGTEVPSKPFRTKRLLIVELNSGSNFIIASPSSSFNANYWIDNLKYLPPSFFGDGTLEVDTSKILFGFGDRRSTQLKLLGSTNQLIGKNNLVERRSFFSVDSFFPPFYISAGPIIRGWKYGLIDGNPHYTSCVFRREKFGQLRDMLEQRQITAFINDEINSPLNYLGNVEQPALPFVKTSQKNSNNFANISTSTFTFDPPIKVGFVQSVVIEGESPAGSGKKLSYETQRPENTASSNISTYATSSLPYFDGISRNRTTEEVSFNNIVVTTLRDAFRRPTII
jgi:hypothetical protein